jgi:AcrR family transcriptional regulator
MTMEVAGTSHLRSDAAANRARIVATAEKLFAQQGLDVSMDEIARAADVGPATLYRRFPTKESLLDAILLGGFEQLLQFANDAARERDAFTGLEHYFARTIQLQLENRAFLEVFMLRLRATPHLAELRRQIRPLIAEIVERAKQQGSLRTDLTAEDIQVLLWQLGRVVEFTGERAPSVWRRYLALTFDGLRPGAARPLPRAGPTAAVIDGAMDDAAERRHRHGRT